METLSLFSVSFCWGTCKCAAATPVCLYRDTVSPHGDNALGLACTPSREAGWLSAIKVWLHLWKHYAGRVQHYDATETKVTSLKPHKPPTMLKDNVSQSHRNTQHIITGVTLGYVMTLVWKWSMNGTKVV